jgi:glutamate--cysteine ligase
MNYEAQKKVITDFLHISEKAPNNFIIGAELEYFVVDSASERSISYYGKDGIKSLLEALVSKGFQPTNDDTNIVGVTNSFLAITLEPGAQFEISLNPQKSVEDLEQNCLQFMQIIEPILKHRGQKLHSSGYHPVSKINEIKFIPKKRYDFMSEYLNNQGSMALNMMKGTASVQVAIDFSSEQDFAKKMLLASRLTPILTAIYDNSPVFEGSPYNDYCLRTKIWNNCDDDRCGIIPQIFHEDFGYEKYAEYLLDLIPIFIMQNGEAVKYVKPFKEIFDPFKNTEQQMNHIFSMCFPDVRARNYIELRMTDSLPYPINIAFLKFINFVFYNSPVFEQTAELLNEITMEDINVAKRETINLGINAKFGNRTIIEYFREIMNFIGEQDVKHFELNIAIAESGRIPRQFQ